MIHVFGGSSQRRSNVDEMQVFRVGLRSKLDQILAQNVKLLKILSSTTFDVVEDTNLQVESKRTETSNPECILPCDIV